MRAGWREVAEALYHRIPGAVEKSEAGSVAELRIIARFFKLPVKTVLEFGTTHITIQSAIPRPPRPAASEITVSETQLKEKFLDPGAPLPPNASETFHEEK